jgi:membrane-associated phospholipid phosphatase
MTHPFAGSLRTGAHKPIRLSMKRWGRHFTHLGHLQYLSNMGAEFCPYIKSFTVQTTPFIGRLPVLFFIFLACLPLSAQQSNDGPYYLSLKREILFGGASVGAVVLGDVLRARTPDIMLSDLRLGTIPSFDRAATRNSSESARKGSDLALNVSGALPLLLLAGNKTRKDAGKLGILFAETMAINYGLTNIIKVSSRRPRPYVFDENLNPTTIIRSNDRAAFLSGHTSVSATGGFFFARAFSDYYPDSKLKPVVWILGAGLPAFTGYLRFRAGQHYPSDIIAGYALGAAVGYLVPTLHKKPISGKGFTLSPTGNGVHLAYRFK